MLNRTSRSYLLSIPAQPDSSYELSQAMSNFAVFPQETFDQIIDDLRDDSKALHTCACVCRAWVPSSRAHFPNTVDIDPSRVHSQQFLKLLCSPLLTITPYIQCLNILYNPNSPRTPFEGFDKWVFDVLPRLKVLEAVKSLSMVVSPSHSVDYESASPYKGLAKYLNDPVIIADVVSSFPVLERLSLGHVGFHDVLIPSADVHPPSTLRHLQANSIIFTPILSWFCSIPQIPFHTVCLTDVPVTEFAIVGQFLRELGASLLHLELRFHHFAEFDEGKCSPALLLFFVNNILYQSFFLRISTFVIILSFVPSVPRQRANFIPMEPTKAVKFQFFCRKLPRPTWRSCSSALNGGSSISMKSIPVPGPTSTFLWTDHSSRIYGVLKSTGGSRKTSFATNYLGATLVVFYPDGERFSINRSLPNR